MQLREKQKAKFIYGILEKPFRNYYDKADRMKGMTGENLMTMLESRLDNVVFRMGFARTRREARQVVGHKHITVNGRIVNIPSYIVKAGQTVGVREKDRQMIAITSSLEHRPVSGSWLTWDATTMTGTFVQVPERAEIPENINEQAIVELYSR
jgi:small subunit ribosomal protein S4